MGGVVVMCCGVDGNGGDVCGGDRGGDMGDVVVMVMVRMWW